MFIAALFTRAKIWNQPKCPLIDRWIKEIYIFIHLSNDGYLGTHTHMCARTCTRARQNITQP